MAKLNFHNINRSFIWYEDSTDL